MKNKVKFELLTAGVLVGSFVFTFILSPLAKDPSLSHFVYKVRKLVLFSAYFPFESAAFDRNFLTVVRDIATR